MQDRRRLPVGHRRAALGPAPGAVGGFSAGCSRGGGAGWDAGDV